MSRFTTMKNDGILPEETRDMRLNTKCSVAIHMLLFINRYGDSRKVTSEVLASSTGCNAVIVRNLLVKLRKAGMISVSRGSGGSRLAKEMEEITFYDVQDAVDPDALKNFIAIHPEPDSGCPIGRNIVNVLTSTSKRLEDAIIREMKNIRLSDIVKDLESSDITECTCFERIEAGKKN